MSKAGSEMDLESLKAQLEKMQQMMKGTEQLTSQAKTKGPQQGPVIKMLIAMGSKPDVIEEAINSYDGLSIDIQEFVTVCAHFHY